MDKIELELETKQSAFKAHAFKRHSIPLILLFAIKYKSASRRSLAGGRFPEFLKDLVKIDRQRQRLPVWAMRGLDVDVWVIG